MEGVTIFITFLVYFGVFDFFLKGVFVTGIEHKFLEVFTNVCCGINPVGIPEFKINPLGCDLLPLRLT
jgi:hypothetical protein